MRAVGSDSCRLLPSPSPRRRVRGGVKKSDANLRAGAEKRKAMVTCQAWCEDDDGYAIQTEGVCDREAEWVSCVPVRPIRRRKDVHGAQVPLREAD